MSGNRCWGSPFTDADVEAARRNGRLLTMELELSRVCNLRCIYCYAESGTALENELTYEEILDAVEQGARLGVRRVIVLGGGEPMAYPRIMDVLHAIHDHGLEIELFTNGTLLTPEIVAEFRRLRVNPVIKFNSLRPEVQDRLAGKAGAFEAIRAGLRLLREAGFPDERATLGAQTVICGPNYDELPDMWRWLRSRSIIPYFETITDQGRAKGDLSLAVPPAKLRDMFQRLARIDREEFGIHWEPKPPVAAFTCRRHLFSCTITTLGDVIPCPGVDIPVGNIRRRPLANILAGSEVIRNLRNIRDLIKGECRECDLSGECYGCRGMAYQFTGDYLASDPLCWRGPRRTSMKLPLPAHRIIPHRDSMLLIDTLVFSEVGSGVAQARLGATSPAVDESGTVSPLIHVELIAQAYAAAKGWEIVSAGRDVPLGYLVGVQKYEVLGTAHTNETLTVRVATAGEFEGFAVVEGSVERDGATIATAKIKLWVPDGEGL
jgi:radical SAM protein with 4Fe4S-binding SPASM domain